LLKKQDKIQRYDDTGVRNRLRTIEAALGQDRIVLDSLFPSIISSFITPTKVSQNDNCKLKLELKALERRLRKLEA